MISIGIGELQKNISIFTNLTGVLQIVDKRKKRVLAMVYPVQKQSMVDKLAGKYKGKISSTNKTFEQIREESMMKAMEDQYDLPA